MQSQIGSLLWQKHFDNTNVDLSADGTKAVICYSRSPYDSIVVVDLSNLNIIRSFALSFHSYHKAVFDDRDRLWFSGDGVFKGDTMLHQVVYDSIMATDARVISSFSFHDLIATFDGSFVVSSRAKTHWIWSWYGTGYDERLPISHTWQVFADCKAHDDVSSMWFSGTQLQEVIPADDGGLIYSGTGYYEQYLHPIKRFESKGTWIYNAQQQVVRFDPVNRQLGALQNSTGVVQIEDSLYNTADGLPEYACARQSQPAFLNALHMLYKDDSGLVVLNIFTNTVVKRFDTPNKARPLEYFLDVEARHILVRYADNLNMGYWSCDFSALPSFAPIIRAIAATNTKMRIQDSTRFSCQIYPQELGTAYVWDFGDGTTSNERSPTHVYTQSGDFNVQLSVRFKSGAVDTMRKAAFIHVEGLSRFINSVTKLSGMNTANWATTLEFNPTNDRLLVGTVNGSVHEIAAGSGIVVHQDTTPRFSSSITNLRYADVDHFVTVFGSLTGVQMIQGSIADTSKQVLFSTPAFSSTMLLLSCHLDCANAETRRSSLWRCSSDLKRACGGKFDAYMCPDESPPSNHGPCCVVQSASIDRERNKFQLEPSTADGYGKARPVYDAAIASRGLQYTYVVGQPANDLYPHEVALRRFDDCSFQQRLNDPYATKLCFNSDADILMTDKKVWRLSDTTAIADVSDLGITYLVALEPSHSIIACATNKLGNQLCMYNVRTLDTVLSLGVGPSSVRSMAVSHDGQWIATGMADGSIIFWKVPDAFLATSKVALPDEAPDKMDVYPNPSDGTVSLRFHDKVVGGLRFSLYNVLGQIVYESLAGDAGSKPSEYVLSFGSRVGNGSYMLVVDRGVGKEVCKVRVER